MGRLVEMKEGEIERMNEMNKMREEVVSTCPDFTSRRTFHIAQ